MRLAPPTDCGALVITRHGHPAGALRHRPSVDRFAHQHTHYRVGNRTVRRRERACARLAESEGFEPPIPLRVLLISNQVPSAARPALPKTNRDLAQLAERVGFEPTIRCR